MDNKQEPKAPDNKPLTNGAILAGSAIIGCAVGVIRPRTTIPATIVVAFATWAYNNSPIDKK
jgi:hypothetical protein